MKTQSFEGRTIRTIKNERGEARFLAQDIAAMLEFPDQRAAVEAFCRDAAKHDVEYSGKPHSLTFISLSDVHEMIMKSGSYKAEVFTEWLNAEFPQVSDSQLANVNSFSFDGVVPVRIIIGEDGEPQWVAKDVAESLGISWDGNRTIAHVPEQWRGRGATTTPSGSQVMATLTEQGLYFFLGRSNKPKALPFQMWVFGEVLPQIRKTGKYAITQAPALPNFSNPAAAARAWADEVEAKEAAQQQVSLLESKVEEMRPTMEFVEVIANTEGAMTINEAAKVLKLQPLKKLRQWMFDNAWLQKSRGMEDGDTLAYQDKVDRGWLVHDKKELKTGKVVTFVMVTQKGFVELSKRYLNENPFDHEAFQKKITPTISYFVQDLADRSVRTNQ